MTGKGEALIHFQKPRNLVGSHHQWKKALGWGNERTFQTRMFNFKRFVISYIIATTVPSSPQFYQIFSKVSYNQELCKTDIFAYFNLSPQPCTPCSSVRNHTSHFVWHGTEQKQQEWDDKCLGGNKLSTGIAVTM